MAFSTLGPAWRGFSAAGSRPGASPRGAGHSSVADATPAQGFAQQQRRPPRTVLAAAGSGAQPSSRSGGGGVPHHVHPQGALSNVVPLELNEFRRGVGLCIFRSDGLVFAARRMDDASGSWQMPQGGIDYFPHYKENPMDAARRELKEETGITNCRIVASIDPWLDYKFPTKVKRECGSVVLHPGQTQKWYLLQFTGDDSEIDLSHNGHPEFSEYCWAPLEALPAAVVHFKRGVYTRVAQHFGPEIARRTGRGSPALAAEREPVPVRARRAM